MPRGYTSLCTPRDFDISPYFQIVKPGLTDDFDYRLVDWIDLPRAAVSELKEEPAWHAHIEVKTRSIPAWE